MIENADIAIDARYIRTGYKSVPAFDDLNRACENLHKSVGVVLRNKRVMVRL
jgi:hypothetical protein